MKLLCSSALVLCLISISAFAQNARQGAGVLAPGVGIPVVTANPGDYNISNTDVARLMSQQMQEFFARQRQDKDFLERSIKELEDLFEELNAKLANERLEERSLRQAADFSASFTIDEFLRLRTQYMNLKARFETRLMSLLSMREALPSQASVQVTQATRVEIPGFIRVDLERIAEYYREKMAGIETRVNALPFFVYDKENIRRPFRGLNPDMSSWLIITEAERTAMNTRLQNMRTQMQPLIEAQDELTDRLRRLVQEVLDVYGVQERGRLDAFGLTEAARRALQAQQVRIRNVVEQLNEVVWSRSYLRVKYALPTGIVPVTYKRQVLNVDAFLRSPSEFIEVFKTGNNVRNRLPVRNQEQMVQVLEDYAQNVQAAEFRGVSIFDSNASMLSRSAALVTQATGYLQLVEVAKIVLPILRVDAEEDLAVMRGQTSVVEEGYLARYHNNAEVSARTKRLECDYENDPDARQSLGCEGAGQTFVAAGAIRTTFERVAVQSNMQLDRAVVIRDLESQLRLASRREQNTERTRSNNALERMRRGAPGATSPTPPTQ
jgi:hypothetical protein